MPELIQEDCQSAIIASYIMDYLGGAEAAKAQVESFDLAVAQLQNGDEVPSEKAASVVLDIIQQHATLKINNEQK